MSCRAGSGLRPSTDLVGCGWDFEWKDEFDQILCADWPLLNNTNIKRVLTGCFQLPIPLFGAKIKKISELPDHLDLR